MEGSSKDERTDIRKELSGMSIEDLLKLKDRLGTKIYNEAMFGTSSSKRQNKRESFKRANKNRPMEVSSKVPVPLVPKVASSKKKVTQFRDPRFDSLCGDFKEPVFRKAYGFVDSIRSKEKEELKEELMEETNPQRKAEIKYLIQRMDNREKEESRRKEKETREREEKQERIEQLRQGQKPHYLTKSERQVKDLVSKYEDLKKSGQLLKRIEKYRKKSNHKDRKRLKMLD